MNERTKLSINVTSYLFSPCLSKVSFLHLTYFGLLTNVTGYDCLLQCSALFSVTLSLFCFLHKSSTLFVPWKNGQRILHKLSLSTPILLCTQCVVQLVNYMKNKFCEPLILVDASLIYLCQLPGRLLYTI